MEAAEFETDALLKLLTDAIRRGPGSPEWHEAVARIQGVGAQGADEYRLLMDVRDRLESGRAYREISAGPEFTRQLFSELDKPVVTRSTTRLMITLVCLLLLAGSALFLMKMITEGKKPAQSTEQLASQLFTTSVQEWSFGGAFPADLKQRGALRTSGALRIDTDKDASLPASAAVWSESPVDDSRGTCIESVIQFRPGGDTRVAVVVGDPQQSDALSADMGDTGFSVVVQGKSFDIKKALPAGAYTLRIKINPTVAVVEVNGQQIWSGEHHLPQRIIPSIRLTRQTDSGGEIRVESLRVLAP